MPGGDGFSLLRRFEPGYNPAIVFVTAFADYAVPAFDNNAVDYLLKPVTRERFRTALSRVKSRMEVSLEPAVPRFLQRIAVPAGEGIRFIKIQEVERFEAEENYIRIHVERKVYLLHATMNRLAESLDPGLFMRVHRSALVKIDSIREVHSLSSTGEYMLTLASGAQVRTGRTYRDSLRALLSNFN
jgi:two-component system LytT family response regulator